MFDYISKMEPLQEPDYPKLRKILSDGIKKCGKTGDKLEFISSKAKTPKSAKKKKTEEAPEASPVRPVRAKRTVLEETEKVKKATPVKLKNSEIKRSWRDFPTIVNGANMESANGASPPKIPKKTKK